MSPNGVGFSGFLLLLFIGLKLSNVIDWSWMWVMAPLWIPLAIALIFIIGATIYFSISGWWWKNRKKRLDK